MKSQTLGVDCGASPDALRQAYRKLAKQHHPDVNNGARKAAERFKAVNETYRVLSDPETRAQYDYVDNVIDAQADDAIPEQEFSHWQRPAAAAQAKQPWKAWLALLVILAVSIGLMDLLGALEYLPPDPAWSEYVSGH